jgi:DNA repair protein RadC
MAISDWRPEERPRERLLAQGASSLSNAELLAILLRTGVRGKSAVELARDVLKQCEGVTHTLEAGAQLEAIKGLGPAKRAQFAAAMELARRAPQEQLAKSAVLTSPGAVRDYLRLKLAGRKEEAFICTHQLIPFEWRVSKQARRVCAAAPVRDPTRRSPRRNEGKRSER